ncbi:MAG: DsbE family thiol:disulfide interchange protein [Rhizomicrobium sp.]|nr:DsbE family thiol:disulfide interchange protein [Rhizomicrobium sp.]
MSLRSALPALALLAPAGFLVYMLLSQTVTPPSDPDHVIGRPVPEFSLPALKAGEQGLESNDLKGQITVINVFASWCMPCRAEHPLLKRLAGNDVVLVGIAYKDKAPDAMRFLAANGNPYRVVLSDNDGQTTGGFGLTGVPETYIIDRNGIIRLRHPGPLTEAVITSDILPALKRLQ